MFHDPNSSAGPMYTPFKFRVISKIQMKIGKMCIKPRKNANLEEESMMAFLFSSC